MTSPRRVGTSAGAFTESHVALIGTGTIGASWAVVFARAGLRVQAWDESSGQLESLVARVSKAVSSIISVAITGAAPEELAGRIGIASALEDAVRGASYVQESVPEDLDIKRAVFARLDQAAASDCILASSVSALPVSAIAKGLRHPQRCVGVHPTNPPHIVPLTEIVPGRETAPEVIEAACNLMLQVGQVPVICRKEIFGFVLNRLQYAVLREALFLIRDGVVSAADVDRVISEGLGLRWAFLGPFGVEEGNANSASESMTKFGEAQSEIMRDLCRPFDRIETADVERATAAVHERYGAYPHERLLELRDQLILRTRLLKQGSGWLERGERGAL